MNSLTSKIVYSLLHSVALTGTAFLSAYLVTCSPLVIPNPIIAWVVVLVGTGYFYFRVYRKGA
jgi:hypothetical protein